MDHEPKFLEAIQKALTRVEAEFAKTPKKKHTALLKEIISGADLAVGVFNDASKLRGWDCFIIKGEQTLTEMTQNRTNRSLKIAAIPCRELEEAVAMKRVFGGLH